MVQDQDNKTPHTDTVLVDKLFSAIEHKDYDKVIHLCSLLQIEGAPCPQQMRTDLNLHQYIITKLTENLSLLPYDDSKKHIITWLIDVTPRGTVSDKLYATVMTLGGDLAYYRRRYDSALAFYHLAQRAMTSHNNPIRSHKLDVLREEVVPAT